MRQLLLLQLALLQLIESSQNYNLLAGLSTLLQLALVLLNLCLLGTPGTELQEYKITRHMTVLTTFRNDTSE